MTGMHRSPPRSLRDFLNTWPMLPVLMTAWALRFCGLGQQSLWLDEIGQAVTASGSWWHTILASVQHHGSTPLDYLVTWSTLQVGRSETVLRLPAVIWGVLSIAVVYRLGRSMFDKPTGYLAAWLLTIAPLHVYYSRELRFYSLATLLALVSVLSLQHAVGTGDLKTWLLFSAATVFALYAHYYALIILAIQGLWLLWCVVTKRYPISAFVSFTAAAGAAILLFMPWLCYDMWYDSAHAGGFWNTGFHYNYPGLLEVASSALFLRPRPLSLEDPRDLVAYLAWGLLIVGGAYSVLRSGRKSSIVSHNTTLVASLVVGGTAVTLISDHLAPYPFQARQLLIYTPMLILGASSVLLGGLRLASSGLARGRNRGRVDELALALLMLVSLLTLRGRLADVYSTHKQDWRGAAHLLLRHMGPNDLLVTPTPLIAGFYAPELTAHIQKLKWTSANFIKQAQSHRRVWILTTRREFARYPQIQKWVERELPIDLSPDASLRLYVWSPHASSAQLLEELLRSGAYTPATLRNSGMIEAAIQDGQARHVLNIAVEMLGRQDLSVAERSDMALRAGRALFHAGELEAAAKILSQASSRDSANPDLLVALASVYLNQDKDDEAAAAYRKALESDPQNYWANHRLAQILARRGEWHDVVNLEKRALRTARNNDDLRAEVLVHLAGAHQKLGNTAKACEALRSAWEISESDLTQAEMARLGCDLP